VSARSFFGGVLVGGGLIFIGTSIAHDLGTIELGSFWPYALLGVALPVSTTHVLSSGVAGAMLANSSGLQMSTVRNLLLAWVLTLPVAMMLSGFLFVVFRNLFKA
jgi:phosphate/sulfate permease